MTVLVRSGSVAGSRRYALELVRPSSVVVAGGGSESATVSALGSVDFSAATSLSLNDVFSAGYDNYMISVRHVLGSGFSNYWMRMRASGTDATATNYTRQILFANTTTIQGARDTTQSFMICGRSSATQRSGDAIYIYGPNLAQPTALRGVNVTGATVSGTDGTQIADNACTHSLSTAYDGFTISPVSSSMTGMIAVYGLRG